MTIEVKHMVTAFVTMYFIFSVLIIIGLGLENSHIVDKLNEQRDVNIVKAILDCGTVMLKTS